MKGCQPVGFIREHEEETVPLALFVSLSIELSVVFLRYLDVLLSAQLYPHLLLIAEIL